MSNSSQHANKKAKYATERLSRSLTSILRHNAVKNKIPIESNGFVLISDLLSNNMFKNNSLEEIFFEVKSNDKKRFQLAYSNGEIIEDDFNLEEMLAKDSSPSSYKIRAVQGHSLENIKTEELLTPILSAIEISQCIHGTFHKFLPLIKESGLSKMKRNHIHFTTSLPQDGQAISGMRKSCEVAIYLDIEKAMADGIKFYLSNNGVILTEGLNGVITEEYFQKVEILREKKRDEKN